MTKFSRDAEGARGIVIVPGIGYNYYHPDFPKVSPTTEPAMTQITIPVQVVNGHLQHEKSLAELEGQHLLATLKLAPKDSANGTPAPAPKALKRSEETEEFDPEPPPWLEIEHDVYFPMPVREKLLEKKPLIVERGTPSIIPPEELSDE